MKKILVTFGTKEYSLSKEMLVNSVKDDQFDEIFSFSEADIKDLKQSFPRHFKKKIGYGFWLWKPYLISRVLDHIADGDIIFYCDAGCLIEHSTDELFRLAEVKNILSFEIDSIQREWTKREVFDAMLSPDEDWIKGQQMRAAAYILFKKCSQTEEFVSSWLSWCKQLELIDNKLYLQQDEDFKWHRNDQSIFSVLCCQFGLEAFRDPSQYGNRYLENYQNSGYSQIINHTRKAKLSLRQRIRKSIFPRIERVFRKTHVIKGEK